ncbi:uncharacterized protein JCM15063_006057 [Sporobolomyces koalae]|uniref:uncharacterized protein n=1 Tax=Sporobolomyces koalae TaxID=500713 RepID=UPI00316CB9B2
MLLPPELWDHVLSFLPAPELQTTALALTRAYPSAEVSPALLWRNLRLTREGQAWQAIHKLRQLDPTAKRAIRTVTATAFREDPQQLVNLLLSLPCTHALRLYVGPLFSPEQLDELLAPASAIASARFTQLQTLSFRFNPYCMERSYFVFLKGTYFDSIVHNLAQLTRETAPRLARLEFIQDLSPNHGSKKKKETPAFGLHELRTELDDLEMEMELRIDASRQPPASGKFTRKTSQEQGKMDFAQPIVFFRLDCLASLSVSPVGRHLTSLTLRLPRRNLLPALTLETSPANPPFASLTQLDLSTSHILDDARFPTLLRLYPRLESLVIDRCTGLVSEDAIDENTAIQTLRWLGKCCGGVGFARAEEVTRSWRRIVKERPTDAPNLPRSSRLRSVPRPVVVPERPSIVDPVDSLIPPVKELFIIPPPPRLDFLGCGLHEISPSTSRLWTKSFKRGYIDAIDKTCERIEELVDRWDLWDKTGKLKDGTRRLCTLSDALETSEYLALNPSSFRAKVDEFEEEQDPDPLFDKFAKSRQLVSITPAIAHDLLELNRKKIETFVMCTVPDCGNLAGIPRLSLNGNGKDKLEDREAREKGIEEVERAERDRITRQVHHQKQSYNPYAGGRHAPELNYPSGFSRNVPERAVHSHNDYWRDTPVYTALAYGVLSIEADVWLNPKDSKLYVSHNVASLSKARTFQTLYVDQLVDVLERANVQDDETKFFSETNYYSQDNVPEIRRPWTSFYEGNLTPIQLLVDLKTRGNETYHAVLAELAPLRRRNWLTSWNGTHVVPGPVQVLLTGNGINEDVRAQVAAERERVVFLDAPLLKLNDTWIGADGALYGWNATLSPMASTSFSSATDWSGRQAISEPDRVGLEKLISSAHARGVKTRFWSTPRWPSFVRERVWRTLFELETDYLDADDIEAVAKL